MKLLVVKAILKTGFIVYSKNKLDKSKLLVKLIKNNNESLKLGAEYPAFAQRVTFKIV